MFSALSVTGDQCDKMARLICQFLANLDNNKKLPNSIKIEPIRFKILQITKSSKKCQRLLKLRQSAEIRQIWSHCWGSNPGMLQRQVRLRRLLTET